MDTQELLWYGNILGELMVLCRFAWLRLLGKYRFFAMFLAVSAIADVALISVSHTGSHTYSLLWTWANALLLVLQVAATLEVFYRITQCYRGITEFGRKVLSVSLGIGGLLTMVLAFIEAQGYRSFIFMLNRLVTVILAVLLLCAAWVFLWVKTRIPRNTHRHCRILTLYCGISALGYFSLHLGLRASTLSLLLLGGYVLCLVLWTLLITREGEKGKAQPGRTAEEGQQALNDLKDLSRWRDGLIWANGDDSGS